MLLPLWPPLSLSLFLPFFPPLGAKSLPFCFATVEKRVSEASAESLPVGPMAGSLPLPMAVCGEGLPFIGPVGKRA